MIGVSGLESSASAKRPASAMAAASACTVALLCRAAASPASFQAKHAAPEHVAHQTRSHTALRGFLAREFSCASRRLFRQRTRCQATRLGVSDVPCRVTLAAVLPGTPAPQSAQRRPSLNRCLMSQVRHFPAVRASFPCCVPRHHVGWRPPLPFLCDHEEIKGISDGIAALRKSSRCFLSAFFWALISLSESSRGGEKSCL